MSLVIYFTSYVLNMFRILIYPSSGACSCVVELPHRLFCSRFVVCWRLVWVGLSGARIAGFCLQQNNGCGNSTTQLQAPDDGYINIRHMLST